MKISEIIEELLVIQDNYGDVECYLIGDYVGSDTVDKIKVYSVNKVIIFNNKDDWTKWRKENE